MNNMLKFWIKKLLISPLLVCMIFSFFYVCVYMMTNHNFYYLDEMISQTNLIAFSIHFVFMGMMIQRNRIIKKNLNNILLRVRQERLINLFLIYTIIEVMVFGFIVYIIPLLLCYQDFRSVSLYIWYVLIWICFFLIVEILLLATIFINNRIICMLLLSIPFVVNILLQLRVMSVLY